MSLAEQIPSQTSLSPEEPFSLSASGDFTKLSRAGSRSQFPGRARGDSHVNVPETFDPEAEVILIRERQKLAMITGIEVPDPLIEFPSSPPNSKLHHSHLGHHMHYHVNHNNGSPPLSPKLSHDGMDTSPKNLTRSVGVNIVKRTSRNELSEFSLDEDSEKGSSIDDFLVMAFSPTYQSCDCGVKDEAHSHCNSCNHRDDKHENKSAKLSPSPSIKVVKRIDESFVEPASIRLSTQHRYELGLISLPFRDTDTISCNHSNSGSSYNEGTRPLGAEMDVTTDSSRSIRGSQCHLSSGATSKATSSMLLKSSLPRHSASFGRTSNALILTSEQTYQENQFSRPEKGDNAVDSVSPIVSPTVTSSTKSVLEMLKTRRRSHSVDGLSTKQSPVSEQSCPHEPLKEVGDRHQKAHPTHLHSKLSSSHELMSDDDDDDQALYMSHHIPSSSRHSSVNKHYSHQHHHVLDDYSDRQRASFRSRSSSPERHDDDKNLESSAHIRSKPSSESLFSKLFHLHLQQNRRHSSNLSTSGNPDESRPTSPRRDHGSFISRDDRPHPDGYSHDGDDAKHYLSPHEDGTAEICWDYVHSTGSAARASVANSPFSGGSSVDGSGSVQDDPSSPKEDRHHKFPFLRSSLGGSHKHISGHHHHHHHQHQNSATRKQNRERSDSDGISNIFKDLMSPSHRRSNSVSHRKSTEGDLDTESNSLSQSHTRSSLSRTTSDVSLSAKYGRPDEVLGKGTYAIVRLAHHKNESKKETLYAIKEYRKKRKDENEKEFAKRLIAEFCISSSMHHENIVHSVDLMQSENGKWCQIMEYCAGGDLLHKTTTVGFSSEEEIHCIFRQMLNGVAYIHGNGVAHRDLKPENILLDANCRIIKITDFGVSAVFKTQFEREPRLLSGTCGSGPYIAPEEWDKDAFYHPTKVDIWAVGMIFISMLNKALPWTHSQISDECYATYLRKRDTGYPNFEKWHSPRKEILYQMLDPDPIKRPEATELIQNEFIKRIRYCTVAPDNHEICIPGNDHIHLISQ